MLHGVTVSMTAQPMVTGAVEGKVCSTLAAIKGSVLVRSTSAWRSSAARSSGCYIRCRYALHVARAFLLGARLAPRDKLKSAYPSYRWTRLQYGTVVQP